MSVTDELNTEIVKILDAAWQSRDGQVVPEDDDVVLVV